MEYTYQSIKDLYENVLQKQEVSISEEMGKLIQEEIKKMDKQKEEWLKNKNLKEKEK